MALKILASAFILLILQSCKQQNSETPPPDYVCRKVSLDLIDRIERASKSHSQDGLDFQKKGCKWTIITMQELAALRGDQVKELYFNFEACKTVNGYLVLDNDSSLIALIKGSNGVSELWQLWPIYQRVAYYNEKNIDPIAPKLPFTN